MPTLGVSAAIFDSTGRILCVRQQAGPRKWTTPGGRVERGESPVEALIREVSEESGYQVEIGELIGVYSNPDKDDVVLCFATKVISREPWQPNSEIAELDFFSRDALPRPMRARTRTRIHDAFEGRRGLVRVFARKLAQQAG